MQSQVTPNVFAVSVLLHARQSQSYQNGARDILHNALWAVIWDLSGDELGAALLLVNLEMERVKALWEAK